MALNTFETQVENHKNTPTYLIVEDDSLDAKMVESVLGAEANIAWVKTVQEAKKYLQTAVDANLCLVDGHLPDGDGVELCRFIREELKNAQMPIIMLTQRSDVGAKVASLGCGADDFISKPFEPLELRARIKALLRRAARAVDNMVYEAGPVMIDRIRQRVFQRNPKTGVEENLHLSQTEFRCLDLLAGSEGQIFSREQILDAVWGSNVHVCDRNVDSFICKLRKKTGLNQFIKSRYGLGYTFTAENY